MEAASAQRPWFGIEQEYTLLDTEGQYLILLMVTNIMCCQVTHWAGPRAGSPGPRVPTTAGWARAVCSGGTSWRRTTGPASTPASGSAGRTLRWVNTKYCSLSTSVRMRVYYNIWQQWMVQNCEYGSQIGNSSTAVLRPSLVTVHF